MYIHRKIIHINQNVEATQMSINRRLDKQMWYTKAKNSNGVLIHGTTRMNIENIKLSERNRSQNTAYCMILFT